ncbi:septation ring formation regulator EzrA [Niallia sp. 03190]|uniref:septation ring formation regulator EzrA n=1 Tax=Niallia sp. 03190 TaxID=3458061 RepID=UPI004044DFBA
MDYIIAGVVIILCLFASGYFIKRKYYRMVDDLENWKIDIMNRPVLEELSKVKQLNMIGQTEELFENWRAKWDDIVTVQLPDVEEMLFDTEEFIDKYKFKKAKQKQSKVRQKMEQMEKSIESMLEELNNLVGSEEKNRTEMETLQEAYRESKKALLAHRHTFGKTEKKLEAMLKDASVLLNEFEEKTNNGDYLEAREIVLKTDEIVSHIGFLIEHIPPLLIECQTKLPEQINELKDGYQEMLEQGFILEHIQLDIEVEEIEKDLQSCNNYIRDGQVEKLQSTIADIQEKIEVLYDLLEKEVLAKNYWNKNLASAKEVLGNINEANERLQSELGLLQRSYHLHNEDLELQYKLEKRVKHLYKQYEVLEHKLLNETAAHSVLCEELKLLKEQLESISDEQIILFEKLHALRKDEVAAREKIKDLNKEITQSIRLVTNSNLPGVTNEYTHLLHDAKKSITKVKTVLEEAPLDIASVHTLLEQAESTVSSFIYATNELVETVLLAEKLIQYGNRYRRKYPRVERNLSEAEAAFRQFQYKEAFERAATTIEEVEPGSTKRLEAWILEQTEKENQYN